MARLGAILHTFASIAGAAAGNDSLLMRLSARFFVIAALLFVQASVTFAQDSTATSLIAMARTRRDQGDAAGAVRFFAEARSLRPLTTGELSEYFWTLRPVNPREALQVARDLLRATPSDGVIRDGAIAAAMAMGDEQSVVALAQEGRMLNDKSAHWHRRLGESLLRSGRGNDAAAMLGLATQKFDAGPDEWMAYAVALTQAGRYQEAVQSWGRVPTLSIPNAPELHRVRLQAFRFGATPVLAATEAEAWLTANPGDSTVRAWTVELWERAGNARAAYAAASALATPAEPQWLRRVGDLARAAGLPDEAMRAYDALLATPVATVEDRRTFAAMAIDAKEFSRGAAVLDTIIGGLASCDEATLQLVERLPGQDGTDRLSAAVVKLGCADSAWGRRAVARAVAEGRRSDALPILQRMSSKNDEERKLEGELLVRTNQPQRALTVLTPLLSVATNDVAVRLNAVDALRATGRRYEAYAAAQPLFRDASLSLSQRMTFAELALNADHPGTALDMLGRLPEPATSAAGRMLRGRALMALGRADEAASVFSALDTSALDSSAASAAIDAVFATRGASAALAYSSAFTSMTPDWYNVAERQVVLSQIAGDKNRTTTYRTRLCGVAPHVCGLADAAAQLALEHPLNALAILQRVESFPAVYQERADDLRATALEQIDRLQESAAIVNRLHERAPAHAGYAARAAFLNWRITADETALQRVIALTSEFPDDPIARTTVARAMHLVRRHDEAIRLLTDAGAPPLTSEGRVLLAELLRDTGDARSALAVIASATLASDHDALLKSELQASQHLRTDAINTLRTWSERPRVSERVFMAWSDLETSGAARVDILQAASRRMPTSARIAAALASERLVVGDRLAARADAERALEIDRSFPAAWTAVLDTTAAIGTDRDMNERIRQLKAESERSPSLLSEVAGYVAEHADGRKSDLARQLLGLLRTYPNSKLPAVARHMAIARLEAGLEEWTAAINAVESAWRAAPESAEVRRLRAEVLVRAGRYSDAVEAWDAYLERDPDSLEARRRQAYAAGMAGRYGDARQMYDSLRSGFSQEPVVAAEAAARLAFYDRRWRDAVAAYDAWLAVEPDNADARFERAMSLRNAGETSSAAEALNTLSSKGYQPATEALSRERQTQMPVFAYAGSTQNMNGYGGLRALSIRRDGGVIDYRLRSNSRVKLLASADRVQVSAATRGFDGFTGEFGGSYSWSPVLSFDVSVGAWAFGRSVLPTVQTRTTWLAGDRTTLNAGFALEPVHENVATVENRLAAAGPFAGVHLATANTSMTARAAWQRLSDGNRVSRVIAEAGRVLSEPLRHVRVLGVAEAIRYARSSPVYFSPSRFIKVDGGVEYTHLFEGATSAGQRQRRLQLAFLEGADNQGVLYHQPRVSLGLGLSRWFFLNSTASMTRSATYRDSSFTIDIGVINLSGTR